MNKKFQISHYSFWYTEDLLKEFNLLGYTQTDLEKIGKSLVETIESTPSKFKGDIIKKTGGAVKLRIAPKTSTKGARNEDRLIYFCLDKADFYFIYVYPKSEQTNLSKAETDAIANLIKNIKESRKQS